MKFIEDFYKEWDGKTYAIVGNGTPPRNMGKEIDSHDIVIRFNGGPTKGFEDLVGSKTTVMGISDVGLLDYFPEILEENYPYHFSLYGKDSKNYVKWKNPIPYPRTYLPEYVYWKDQTDVLQARKPTAGFRQLFHLYKNNIKADVYGVDGYTTRVYYHKEAGDLFGFWSGRERKHRFLENKHVDAVHNAKAEMAFWEKNPWHNFRR